MSFIIESYEKWRHLTHIYIVVYLNTYEYRGIQILYMYLNTHEYTGIQILYMYIWIPMNIQVFKYYICIYEYLWMRIKNLKKIITEDIVYNVFS